MYKSVFDETIPDFKKSRVPMLDKMKTSDEILYDVAMKKLRISGDFLDTLKNASIDCKKDCFKMNVKNTNDIIYPYDFKFMILDKDRVKKVYKTFVSNNISYAYDPESMFVYLLSDLKNGNVKKFGVLKIKGKTSYSILLEKIEVL